LFDGTPYANRFWGLEEALRARPQVQHSGRPQGVMVTRHAVTRSAQFAFQDMMAPSMLLTFERFSLLSGRETAAVI
jgi:hypothetical protein